MKKVLRLVLLVLSILLGILLIASTLVGLFPPSKAGVFSVLAYAYFYLLIANVLLVVLWISFGKWYFLVPVAAILARCSFIPLYFQLGLSDAEESVSQPQSAIKVLDCNLHGLRGRNGNLLAEETVPLFLGMVADQCPDVMSFQEFGDNEACCDSLLAMGYYYHCTINEHLWGINLFSRFPIIAASSDNNQLCVDLALDSARVIRVIAIHADSYRMDMPENHAKGESDDYAQNLVRKLVKTSKDHEYDWNEYIRPLVSDANDRKLPLIVMGDFNDPPASFFAHTMREHLSDSFVEKGRGFGTTYHGLFPAFRIDYVLHNSVLRTLSYERLRLPISDHNPIVVQFAID